MPAREELHPLAQYLYECGRSAEQFAAEIGASAAQIEDAIAGRALPLALARRVVAASNGAVSLADLAGPSVVEARGIGGVASEDIDAATLERALAPHLAALLGGARRAGDRALARLGAEAAVNTYLALEVTGRRPEDRLVLALRPVLQEILEDCGAPPRSPEAIADAATAAATTYFQVRRQKRP